VENLNELYHENMYSSKENWDVSEINHVSSQELSSLAMQELTNSEHNHSANPSGIDDYYTVNLPHPDQRVQEKYQHGKHVER
jgi:hypothetical protein